MSKRFICSDAHLGHRNITKYRTNFSSAEEHHNIIYDNIASVVSKRDVLWLLGDIAFDKYWLEKVSKIPCRKILIVGNHDLDFGITMKDLANTYDELYSLKSKHNMWFSHCPIHPKEMRNRTLCIHGHCIPYHHEILTEQGWKDKSTICENDLVYTYNPKSECLELKPINYVIDKPNYKGDVWRYDNKSNAIDVTEGHMMIDFTNNYNRISSNEFFKFSNRKVRVSGNFETQGTGLQEGMLKLYIALAADGNLTPANLCRFYLKRKYKTKWLRGLLQDLGISYTTGVSKHGEDWTHFRLPNELSGWNVKGLDRRLLQATRQEVSYIIEAYKITDGYCAKGSDNVTIYTAKKEEYDLLQHLFTINSYKAKGYSRYHGFGNNLQYQLYISDKQFYSVSVTKFARKITSNGDDYWCINVDNHNFFTRTHKGNVYLTGNCHGDLVPEYNYINVCMEHTDYKPVTFADLPDLQERQIDIKRNL